MTKIVRPHSAPGSKLESRRQSTDLTMKPVTAGQPGHPPLGSVALPNPQPWPCHFHSRRVFCRVPAPCLPVVSVPKPCHPWLLTLANQPELGASGSFLLCTLPTFHKIYVTGACEDDRCGKEGPRREVKITQLWLNQGGPRSPNLESDVIVSGPWTLQEKNK